MPPSLDGASNVLLLACEQSLLFMGIFGTLPEKPVPVRGRRGPLLLSACGEWAGTPVVTRPRVPILVTLIG